MHTYNEINNSINIDFGILLFFQYKTTTKKQNKIIKSVATLYLCHNV